MKALAALLLVTNIMAYNDGFHSDEPPRDTRDYDTVSVARHGDPYETDEILEEIIFPLSVIYFFNKLIFL